MLVIIKNWKIYFRAKPRIVRKRTSGMIKHSAAEEKRLRVGAKMVVTEKVAHFNQYYGFIYGKVFIKNQRTRWGSCSSRGNLNFNYRIALLPEALQNYLVVHELCHLKEMNHGANFWNLVAEQIPNCKALSKQLKTYSL